MKTATRKVSKQSLIKKLDVAYSLYIRLRDTDKNGIGRCITCGKFGHYKNMHCGHFLSRRHMATRWDEQNTHLQCVSCNTFNQGRQYEMGVTIDKKHGPGTASKLLIKSKSVCNWQDYELEAMAGYYKRAVKELREAKGMV